MSFRIAIADSDIAFACESDESILEAAERAGYTLPYSCRQGICSTCQGTLVDGTAWVRGEGEASGQREDVAFCQARPRSDLLIRPSRIEHSGPPVRRRLKARLFRIARPADDVTILHLRFPNGVRQRFTAGQYVRLFLPDGESRSYSIANAPHEKDGVQLHVRHVPGGRFSGALLAELRPGSLIDVELPYGVFELDRGSARPAILLATGTGFAPMMSIVADQIRRGETRPLHLYWGGRHPADLYLGEQVERWAAAHHWLSYTPVLSRADADWQGRRGHVQDVALADHADLSGHDAYACGNPEMVDAARRALVAAGLPGARFSSDAFVPSGNVA